MTYWLILIPLSFFLFMLVKSILRTRHVATFYNLLLMWYSLSLICNIASGLFFTHQFRLANTVFFTLAVYLFTRPFRFLRLDHRPALLSSPSRYFYPVAVIVIALSLTSIFFDLPKVSPAFASGDFGTLRQAIAVEGMTPAFARRQESIVEIVGGFSNALYFISLTLFFVALVKGYARTLTVVLFISSLSKVVFYLTQAGRTGLTLWIFFFLVNFLFFRRFMSPEMARKVTMVFVVIAVCLVTAFVIISRNRFTNYLYFSSDGVPVTNPITGVLDYMGQPFANFDYFVEAGFAPRFHGAFMFPLVARGLGSLGSSSNSLDWMYGEIRHTIPENWYVFATFLREFWYDFGPVGVLVLGGVFGVLVRTLCRQLNDTIRVRSALLFFILYSIPFMGLFSYPLSHMHDNFGLLALLLIPF